MFILTIIIGVTESLINVLLYSKIEQMHKEYIEIYFIIALFCDIMSSRTKRGTIMTVRFRFINLYHCEGGFDSSVRVFDYGYFLYCHKGTGIFRIAQTDYTMKAGDICFCPPNTPNTIIADQKDPFVLSGLEFDILSNVFTDRLPRYYNIYRADYFVKQCVLEMLKECTARKAGYQTICTGILTTMCYKLLRKPILMEDQSVDEIIHYLNENYNKDIKQKELAQLFNYHRNSINNIIKRATGLTVKQTLIEIRLQHAMTFLKYSNKSIGEISEMCGYNSPTFFIRQFKEKTGVTPYQFRQKTFQSK